MSKHPPDKFLKVRNEIISAFQKSGEIVSAGGSATDAQKELANRLTEVFLGVADNTSVEDELSNINTLVTNIRKDAHYTHTQLIDSSEWYVKHNLGKRPTVAVTPFDEPDVCGLAAVKYINDNELIVYLQPPIKGFAYCN